MTITSGIDVYSEHGDAYDYNDKHGNSTWTGKYLVITSVETHVDGIKITTENQHGFIVGQSVSVVETTSYNNTKDVVSVVDYYNFTLAITYVSDESSGYVGTEANIKANEVALRKATEWIDQHPNHKGRWRGSITETSQLLSHPRSGLYDEEGRVIASNEIALEVINSCIEMANKVIADTETLFPDISAGAANLKKKKIDVIEREWFHPSQSSQRKTYDYVNNLLSGLLFSNSGVMSIQRTY
jgi:hypothetical protein